MEDLGQLAVSVPCCLSRRMVGYAKRGWVMLRPGFPFDLLSGGQPALPGAELQVGVDDWTAGSHLSQNVPLDVCHLASPFPASRSASFSVFSPTFSALPWEACFFPGT